MSKYNTASLLGVALCGLTLGTMLAIAPQDDLFHWFMNHLWILSCSLFAGILAGYIIGARRERKQQFEEIVTEEEFIEILKESFGFEIVMMSQEDISEEDRENFETILGCMKPMIDKQSKK